MREPLIGGEPGELTARPASGVPAAATAPPRVLIVDDNPELVRALGWLLRSRGLEVREAFTGAEALARATEDHPDAILLDLSLPDADGCAVARQLRALPELAATPLVAISGYDSESDRARTRAAGFDLHLGKPVQASALLAALAALGVAVPRG